LLTVNKTKSDIKKSSPQRPSLVINAISTWVALGVNIIVVLLLTPFIIGHLGENGFGIWVLVGSFLGYYGLLNLGVRAAAMRYIARYAGQGHEKALNETASTTMAMFSCTGVLAIVVSFFLAAPLASFFDVAPEHVNDFKHVIWILGLATGLSFPSNVFESIVVAHERYVAINSAKIVCTLVRVGFVVLMLLRGQGLVGVACATLIATIVAFVANFLIYRHFTPQVRLRCASAKWGVFRMLLVYGGVTTVIVIADIMRFNFGSIVVGKCVGIPEVGVYGIAAMIIRYMLRIITAGMSVLVPRFAALDGAKENAKLQSLFMRSMSVSAVLGFGAGMMAIIFGGRFIILWVGKEFTGAVPVTGAIPVLWILAISYAFALSQAPGINLMYALNKHYYYAVVTILEAGANVIISILLAPKYGIIGVAFGTAIPMLTVKLFVQPIYVAHIVGISIWDYIKRIIIPATLAGLMIGMAYSLGNVISLDKYSLAGFVTWGIISGLIFVGIVFVVFRQVGFWLPVGKRS